MSMLTVETGTSFFRDLPDQIPFWPPTPEESSLANMARAIAAQHLKDRELPYLNDPVLCRKREEAWRNIAMLNSEQRSNIVTLMRGFELAKASEYELIAKKLPDPLSEDTFDAIRNPDSRNILLDMLRAAVHHTDYDDDIVYAEETSFYGQIGNSLYGERFRLLDQPTHLVVPFLTDKYSLVSEVTPETLIKLALQYKINAPRNLTYPLT